MDAQKAVDLGFVDEIIRAGKKPIAIPVKNAAYANALRNYKNVPAALLAPEGAKSPELFNREEADRLGAYLKTYL